ncbi:MAG TPA: MSEP-CTERM sorting domain-containing protein [Niabella sp.]
MKIVLNPKWIFAVNTVPVILLFILYGRDFTVIRSLLKPASKEAWFSFAAILLLITVGNLFYAVKMLRQRKSLSLQYGIIALLLHVSFVYAYLCWSAELFPFSIPSWMISEITLLYGGTFLMPAMVYSLLIIVIHCTRRVGARSAWLNLAASVPVPIVIYLFFLGVFPTWSSNTYDNLFVRHLTTILLVAATILFLFLLFRAAYIFVSKKGRWLLTTKLIWSLIVSVVLPLLGLFINKKQQNFFGDFSGTIFWVLAVFNGVLLYLPDNGRKVYRLLLFTGRCFTFGYTLYFLFVFLPFLPLSVIAVLFYGAGILLLTPFILFFLHLHLLYKQFRELSKSQHHLLAIGVAGFLLLPAGVIGNYYYDRYTLHNALAYVYSPDLSKQYAVNNKSLSTALQAIDRHTHQRIFQVADEQQPYLSSVYKWIVLDNLTLSAEKERQLKNVFFDEVTETAVQPRSSGKEHPVRVSGLNATTKYDPQVAAWVSTLNIELTNTSGNDLQEYVTSFHLPKGCFVSNYYLYTGNKKEPGILTEKRTAQWVFNQIQNEQRDPGILYYNAPGLLTLKIFPFNGYEKRRTGIEFIHKDPVTLTIDNKQLQIGDTIRAELSHNTATSSAIYIPAAAKQQLPRVFRKPYYHFIVDASAHAAVRVSGEKKKLYDLIKALDANENGKISFVNSYTTTLPVRQYLKRRTDPVKHTGGFFLERAIRQSLAESYLKDKEHYPVFVVITDHFERAVKAPERLGLAFTFPENGCYFVTNTAGGFDAYSLRTNAPDVQLHWPNLNPVQVLAYPNTNRPRCYIAADKEASVIALKNTLFRKPLFEKKWDDALALEANAQLMQLFPHKAEEEWRSAIKASFQSKFLTAATAYLVVETEAQRQALYRKQQEVLSGNKNLDVEDEPQQMSEPGWELLIILLLIVLVGKRKRPHLFLAGRSV